MLASTSSSANRRSGLLLTREVYEPRNGIPAAPLALSLLEFRFGDELKAVDGSVWIWRKPASSTSDSVKPPNR